MILSDKGFGFINLKDMPSGEYSFGNLKYTNTSWAATKDYKHMAKNHCGAVFVTNLVLYFASIGYSNLIVDKSKDNTFAAVHRIVGNGPVITVARKAKEYFYERGYTLEYSRVVSLEDIKEAISDNQPLGVLLTNGIFSWHWIMVVGWRQYKSIGDSEENYLRIVDSWNQTADRFFKVGSDSILWSTTKYRLSPL